MSNAVTICPTCNKEVKGAGISALGKTYHVDHFQCVKCKVKITDKYQVDSGNNPFCPECAVKFLGIKINICETCKQEIEGKMIKVMGKFYHPEHFLCTGCKKPIDGKCGSYEDKPYCEKCMEQFVEKCSKCGKNVGEKFVKAAGKTFHPDCFICYYCSASLTSTPFKEREGKMLCQSCYIEKFAKKCETCKKPIQGEAVEALGTAFHPDCFTCTRCNVKITENFAIIDNKQVCSKCAENIK